MTMINIMIMAKTTGEVHTSARGMKSVLDWQTLVDDPQTVLIALPLQHTGPAAWRKKPYLGQQETHMHTFKVSIIHVWESLRFGDMIFGRR